VAAFRDTHPASRGMEDKIHATSIHATSCLADAVFPCNIGVISINSSSISIIIIISSSSNSSSSSGGTR
jgi:hypothetical protein